MLSAAVAWDLPNKLELAASAAVAAMSAAGLVGQDTQQQQQQSSGSGDSKQSRPVARTAADAVLLLHRFRMIGYQPPQQLTHHLLSFIAPRLHQVSLMQVRQWLCWVCFRVGCVYLSIWRGSGGVLLWGGGLVGACSKRCDG